MLFAFTASTRVFFLTTFQHRRRHNAILRCHLAGQDTLILPTRLWCPLRHPYLKLENSDTLHTASVSTLILALTVSEPHYFQMDSYDSTKFKFSKSSGPHEKTLKQVPWQALE